MINTPTVFVLGAGASIPYGFPSGADLRRNIIRDFIRPLQSAAGVALTLTPNLDLANAPKFADAFSRSNISSIDAFLSKRQEFVDVGKAAIAAELCAREIEDNLFSDDIKDHWYRLLWNSLMADTLELADITRNAVRFITFNYDRSLEHFLHQSIKHSWGVADVHALTILRDIRTLHVYGSLGPFHFQKEDGYRTYGEPLSGEGLGLAAASIQVIPEARKDEIFVEVRKWFDWAKHICFLGFGFDRLNMERLGLNLVLSAKTGSGNPLPKIFVTTLGRTGVEQTDDRRRLLGEGYAWEAMSVTCSDILRNTPLLLG
jgi:hypothetical protein